MRPSLEYVSSIWSSMASQTIINKLHFMQNTALRACTGCTYDLTIQHLHDVPYRNIYNYMHCKSDKKTEYPSHPLYRYITHNTLHSSQLNLQPLTFPDTPQTSSQTPAADIKANMRDIHTSIVSQHLAA